MEKDELASWDAKVMERDIVRLCLWCNRPPRDGRFIRLPGKRLAIVHKRCMVKLVKEVASVMF